MSTQFGEWGQLTGTRKSLKERFLDKITYDGDHWMWQGASIKSYGAIVVGSRTKYAHRVSYELFKGPIPTGHKVHPCEIKFCVNPSHFSIAPVKSHPIRSAHP